GSSGRSSVPTGSVAWSSSSVVVGILGPPCDLRCLVAPRANRDGPRTSSVRRRHLGAVPGTTSRARATSVGAGPACSRGTTTRSRPLATLGGMRTERAWRRLYATGWVVSALVGAAAVQQWQQRMRAVEERLAEAERGRAAVVQRVAAEERLRIARELHDSLTHSISVIKVQSGVAAHLARKRGEQVPEALLAIEEAAGDAARELRETLDVLRRDGDHDRASRGLDDLPRLLEQTRAAGVAVTAAVEGEARDLPREVDRAAYRIVQEALTNVARHAGPATARVRIRYGPDRLGIEVVDDGAGPQGPSSGSGLGLIGMRERATALGGRL